VLGRLMAYAVPILAYHSIGSPPSTAVDPDLYVRQRDFRAQVRWLDHRGFHAVTLDRVEDAWSGRRSLPGHPIVISFDDGFASQFLNAYPLLRARRWPGVLNLPLVPKTGGAAQLQPEEVSTLVHHGWELDSHSISHPLLTSLGPRQLHRQVARSRLVLEREFGVAVPNFCYPFGAYDDRVIRAVRRAGYRGATGLGYGLATPRDRFHLDRVVIDRGDGLAGLEAKLAPLVG
jgi:peptidoglycan/xylan/chitin deacetylase (PgdA/CDA1 family)